MEKAVIFHHVANMGGGTISLIDVCHALSKEYEVTVIIPKRNSDTLASKLSLYAKVILYSGRIPEFSYYSGASGICTRGFLNSFFVKKEDINNIVDIIEAENPDVIIANSVVQLRMGKYLSHIDAKKVLYIRETFIENTISRFMIKFINKYFDGVLCISPYEKQYASFQIPCEVVADCQVNNCTDKNNRIKLSDKHFNLLYMGGSAQLKGFDIILDSLQYITSPSIRLVIAGNINKFMPNNIKNIIIHKTEFAYEQKVKSLLDRHKDKIDYIGFVDDIESVMTQADAVVFPSSKPHQPRPAIEAGACGTAVILSDFIQTEAFFKDGYNCLTFKQSNSKDLAEKIEKLYKDSELRKKLITNNKKMNEEFHNFEKEGDKLLSFIKRI